MKLSKNIISNISTDYNKIKPKNVSKPNNHKKQQKGNLSASGSATISYNTDDDFDNSTNFSNFSVGISGSGELDNGMSVSVNFELDDESDQEFDNSSLTLDSDSMGTLTFNKPSGTMSFKTVNTKNYDSKIIYGIESNSGNTTQTTIENNGKIVNNGTMKNIKEISGSGDIVLNNASVDSFEVKSHPNAHFKFNTLNSYLHHNKYLNHFNSPIENNKRIYKLKKPTLFFGKYKTNHKTTVIISKLSTKDEVLNLQNNNLIVGINLINRSSIILPEQGLLSFYKSSVNNHKLNLRNQNNG